MISLSGAVQIVVGLIIAGLVFGLLFWLIGFCESQFPSAAPFFKVARIILVIIAVLVLIGILLNFAGYQVFRP